MLNFHWVLAFKLVVWENFFLSLKKPLLSLSLFPFSLCYLPSPCLLPSPPPFLTNLSLSSCLVLLSLVYWFCHSGTARWRKNESPCFPHPDPWKEPHHQRPLIFVVLLPMSPSRRQGKQLKVAAQWHDHMILHLDEFEPVTSRSVYQCSYEMR